MMKIVLRNCSYCGSKEGWERPIGKYVVELKELDDNGSVKLACQSCYLNRTQKLKHKNDKNDDWKEKLVKRLKNVFIRR